LISDISNKKYAIPYGLKVSPVYHGKSGMPRIYTLSIYESLQSLQDLYTVFAILLFIKATLYVGVMMDKRFTCVAKQTCVWRQ
jgi:hypothetical protein